MGVSVSSSGIVYNGDGEALVNGTENLLTFTEDFAGAQAGATILTPAAGKFFEIHSITISTEDKLTDVTVELDGGDLLFKLYTTNQQTGFSARMHKNGAINEAIKLTCGAGTFITIVYHEK